VRAPSRILIAGLSVWSLTGLGFPVRAAAQEPITDLTPPEIHVPADITTTATSAAGAQVFYVVTVTNDTAPIFLQCTGPSGSVFPVGTRQVTCIALDFFGNFNQKTFNITVNPGAATAALANALTTIATSGLAPATQRDLLTLLDAIAAPPSATRKCDKMDPTKDRADLNNGKLGNRDSCLEKDVAKAQKAFADQVTDSAKSKNGTAPAIPPSSVGPLLAAAQLLATETVVGATNTPPVLAIAGNVTTKIPPPDVIAAGATSVLYTDRNNDPTNPPPNPLGPICTPPSGTQFPLGTTTVTCTANTTGGTTTKSFTVMVQPR